SLTFNYSYEIPTLARKGLVPANVVTKVVLDGWQLSGVSSFVSGAPVNIVSSGITAGYTVTGIGASQLNRMITGSEDVAPRVVFTCNPNLPHGDKTIDQFFDTSCFAPAPKGSKGMDSGYNQMHGPGIQGR